MLEVGCGRGVALSALTRLCAPTRLAGFDVDCSALAEAAGRLGARSVEADLVVGDVRNMPFADGSFDIVIDFGTCYHISNSEAALRDIVRVLDRRGLFVYETPANQLISHPIRSFGRTLPWGAAQDLRPHKARILWSSRIKVPVAP
jgi:ubiquinone/menaquinone biosynthesis C-methylase UbiE